MHMFAIAYINSATGFSAELMKMFIGEVGVKFNFMKMIAFVFGIPGFFGHCAESVIVAVAAFVKNFSAASQFMDMFLFVIWVIILIVHNEILSESINLKYAQLLLV